MPGRASIDRRRESDVAAAPANAARPSGHMERADNGVAPRERIGLNFGLMIAVSVSEIIHTDSGERSLCGRTQRKRERKGQQGQQGSSTKTFGKPGVHQKSPCVQS